ncbi:hypothetical protein L195_g044118, partial [Trifolium pratense]
SAFTPSGQPTTACHPLPPFFHPRSQSDCQDVAFSLGGVIESIGFTMPPTHPDGSRALREGSSPCRRRSWFAFVTTESVLERR